MRTIVVTGTGTNIGKTIVSAMLASLGLAAGLRVVAVKPAQTGVGTGDESDIDAIRRLTGLTDAHELVRYEEPLAPATAARRLGTPGVRVSELGDAIARLHGRDLVVVEGAGGALVRLNAHGETILDLASALRRTALTTDTVEVLVTTSCGLGTLHSTAATCESIVNRGLNVDHLVVADWPAAPGIAEQSNLHDLPQYTGAPLHGLVPQGCGSLERAEFARAAQAALTPHLGGARDPAGFAS